MLEATKTTSTETPWGLSWNALLSTLRPNTSELNLFTSIFTTVDAILKSSPHPPDRLIPGSAFGKGTLLTGEKTLDLYAIFTSFQPESYFDRHLNPILQALSTAKSPHFTNLLDKGLAVCFVFEAISCRIFAAGELYAGPKELLLYETSRRAPPTPPRNTNRLSQRSDRNSLKSDSQSNQPDSTFPAPEVRAVHVETSCAVLRVNLIAAQPPLYKDMVRVAKKWRASSHFMIADDVPGDYLLELLMLDAFHGAPAMKPSPDMYATIFRRFLALAAAQSGTASDVVADDAMPKLFLSWTSFYNQGAIDHSIASGLLKTADSRADRSPLVVIDPAVPFINVAQTVADWGELRKAARDSLSQFQNEEVLESLQTRLNALTEGMQETLGHMQAKLDHLQNLEDSPRRWSGTIQFREPHLNDSNWTLVKEVQLRTVTWRINARKARSDGVGYSSFVDVSLQMIGKPLTRTIDVDVSFRGTSNLVFDPATDHVLFARRSEVIRNRDYAVQITIVA